MGIVRCEPHKKGPVAQVFHPAFGPAGTAPVVGAASRPVEIMQYRPCGDRRRIAEMPLPSLRRIIPRRFQRSGDGNLLRTDRRMEFAGPRVVGITPRKDARAARTARTGRQDGVGKAHSGGCEGVDVGRADNRMSVTSEIVAGNVVGDQHQDVRAFRISAFVFAVGGSHASGCQRSAKQRRQSIMYSCHGRQENYSGKYNNIIQ